MIKWWIGCAILIATMAVCPLLGADLLHFADYFSDDALVKTVIWDLRLPRLLAVVCIGGILSVQGGMYQGLFQNPLAEPYLLGISSAATLGVAVGEMYFGIPARSLESILIGIACGGSATLALLALSFGSGRVVTLVLFGMGLNFVLSSILFVLVSVFSNQVGPSAIRWLFGQIPWLNWRESLTLGFATLGFLIGSTLFSRRLDALQLGDSVARTMGFNPRGSRLLFLSFSSILLAVTASLSGAIGFIGLVVPHLVKRTFHPASYRGLFLYSFVVGGTFLSWMDVLSRTLRPPLEFPIGVLTTIFGGPVFLWVLVRARAK